MPAGRIPEIVYEGQEVEDLRWWAAVECWGAIMKEPQKSLWHAEFNKNDRMRAAYWMQRFARWHVDGAPRIIKMRPDTYQWLKFKLVPFLITAKGVSYE